MSKARRTVNSYRQTVLIAEDDVDDQVLLIEIFSRLVDCCEIRFVENGEELLEYLLHRNGCTDPASPRPALILLDLHMPKKDGREALMEIKECADLKDIPLIVWTTSMVPEDRVFCAKAGASDYVTKPSSFVEMDEAINHIVRAWLPARDALQG